jgi:Methyltransferase domain
MSENCRVCHSKDLIKFNIDYFECANCRYVQTETPYWLEEAYADPINFSDVGIMARNLGNIKVVLASLRLLKKLRGTMVDYSGGYGILVRLLRDVGVDAKWHDPYCSNILAPGFEYSPNEAADLVTCFEAFEHFVDPVAEFERVLSISPNVLISTEIIASPAPPPESWYYYGLDHGQHIGFFRSETLEYLAHKFGKKLVSDGKSFHLFTDLKINRMAWKTLSAIGRGNYKILAAGLTSRTLTDFNELKYKQLQDNAQQHGPVD